MPGVPILGEIGLKEEAAPSTPASGVLDVYADTSHYLHTKDSTGADYTIPHITVSTSAPSSPATGDLWVDTN